MTTFEGGPAEGVVLALGRAPVFLRVVETGGGEFDALDQLDDEPAPGEKVHAYVLVGKSGVVHINGRDAKGKRFGRWYASAKYRYHHAQPSEAQTRTTATWQSWCMTQTQEKRS